MCSVKDLSILAINIIDMTMKLNHISLKIQNSPNHTYIYLPNLCVYVFPPPGAEGAKTGLKSQKLGQRHQNPAKGPKTGAKASKLGRRPTETEIMLAKAEHQSSSQYLNFNVMG